MVKIDLIRRIASKTNATHGAIEQIFDAFCDVIKDAMYEGEKVTLPNIGSFSVKEVPERHGKINLGGMEGKDFVIPAHNEPRFKPSKAFKELLIDN